MIISTENKEKAYELFDKIGIKKLAQFKKTAVIKVNIARPPEKNQPRTSPELITLIVEYLSKLNVKCAIAEGANGYLSENLYKIGLGNLIREHKVELVDLDFEEAEKVEIEDEEHYIPRCLNNYDIRIAIPSASKRPNMVFSNNIKLFVGAVPRRFYQIGEPVEWRPKVHIDLHKSIRNIYTCITKCCPFDFYINGGLAMDEEKGEFQIPEIIVGDDALELDLYIIEKYFGIDKPEYITKLL